MRLIVGLGNPGAKYRDTPHNAGFQVCDRFSERHRLGAESRKFQGLFWRGRIGDEDIGVLKPQTYMNLSGQSVGEAVRYLPVESPGVILVWDELDLPRGKIRVRQGGGDGGHLGARSVIEHLGMKDFPRVRVGVGRAAGSRNPVGHLLGKAKREQRDLLAQTIDLAVDALDAVLADGVAEAMNRFNGLPAIGEPEQGEEKK